MPVSVHSVGKQHSCSVKSIGVEQVSGAILFGLRKGPSSQFVPCTTTLPTAKPKDEQRTQTTTWCSCMVEGCCKITKYIDNELAVAPLHNTHNKPNLIPLIHLHPFAATTRLSGLYSRTSPSSNSLSPLPELVRRRLLPAPRPGDVG